MEKRLPLALFLSFLILFGWSLTHRPEPEDIAQRPAPGAIDPLSVPDAGPSGADPVAPGGLVPAQPDLPEPTGPVIQARERWQQWIEFGTRGEPGFYHAFFDNRGGSLAELRTGNFFDAPRLSAEEKADQEHWTKLLVPVETDGGVTSSMALRTRVSSKRLVREPLETVLWQHEILEEGDTSAVRFTYAPGTGVTFTKTIRPVPGRYRFELELAVTNDNPELSGYAQFGFTPAGCVPQESEDRYYVEPQAVAAWGAGDEPDLVSVQRDDRGKEPMGDLAGSGPLAFAGVHNKYFVVDMSAADEEAQASLGGASYRRIRDFEFAREAPENVQSSWRYLVTDVELRLLIPDEGKRSVYRYDVYAGPKDRGLLIESNPAHIALVEDDLGFFTTIASLLQKILGFFHGLTGNWGWAIIFLTLSVRLAMFPAMRKMQVSMARHQTKMKRVQPKLNEIKEKYADNPQKLRQEQARVMQEEGAFPPLGGCLPMLVQIPIFIGLFQSLRTSFDLRQAPFHGWIRDLSMPDQLIRLDFNTHLPFIGTIEWLNVLPILMVVLWVMQQKVMPKPTDEQALRMQKIMVWMPVMFGFMLYNYAAGLSLYMVTTSTFGILEQTVVKKIWPIDATEVPRKKSGFMARLAELQEQAQKQQAGSRKQGGSRGAKGVKAKRR